MYAMVYGVLYGMVSAGLYSMVVLYAMVQCIHFWVTGYLRYTLYHTGYTWCVLHTYGNHITLTPIYPWCPKTMYR